MKKPITRKLRCAIYTRKSTEEGLDMEFNSLDAQREACEAFILSQRAEGWVLVTNNEREFCRVPGLAVENWVAAL